MLVIAIARKWHKLFSNLATFWHTRFGLWSSAVTCLFRYCHCQTVNRQPVIVRFCADFLTYQERGTYSSPRLTLNKDIYFTKIQYSFIIFLFQHRLSYQFFTYFLKTYLALFVLIPLPLSSWDCSGHFWIHTIHTLTLDYDWITPLCKKQNFVGHSEKSASFVSIILASIVIYGLICGALTGFLGRLKFIVYWNVKILKSTLAG